MTTSDKKPTATGRTASVKEPEIQQIPVSLSEKDREITEAIKQAVGDDPNAVTEDDNSRFGVAPNRIVSTGPKEEDALKQVMTEHPSLDVIDEGINPKDLLATTKPKTDAVPPSFGYFTQLAFEDGVKKYGKFNWRKRPVVMTTYLNAAQRHLDAIREGIDRDDESGAPHAAHIAACMAIILDAKVYNSLIDDREENKEPGRFASFLRGLEKKNDKG